MVIVADAYEKPIDGVNLESCHDLKFQGRGSGRNRALPRGGFRFCAEKKWPHKGR
jgi:hypothetical protein